MKIDIKIFENSFYNDSNNDIKLKEWYDHLESVFGYKGTPREYFVKHHESDPSFNVIFIAYDTEKNQIASTIKLFTRTINIDQVEYKVGGIGEVSTKEQYRGHHLSFTLLNVINARNT
eukprot:gene2008-2471_t